MSNALVAIDARSLSSYEIARMDFGGATGLLGEVHCNRRSGSCDIRASCWRYMLGKLKAHVEKFLAGVDSTENLAPYLLGRLHLPRDLDARGAKLGSRPRPRARGLARRDARPFDHSSMSQTASLARHFDPLAFGHCGCGGPEACLARSRMTHGNRRTAPSKRAFTGPGSARSS